MKIDQKLWENDKDHKRFLVESKHQLNNSTKRYKRKPRETIQIRVTKKAHEYLKYYAWNHDKTITSAASDIFERIFERGDEAYFFYDFL